MFQIFQDPKIDFIGKMRIMVSISLVLIVLAIAALATRGLNRGIEFTGGTELQVKYASKPDVGAIRASLAAVGFTNQVVTTIGAPEENEVYVRIGLQSETEELDLAPKIAEALRPPDVQERIDSGLLNLNTADGEMLTMFLRTAPELTQESAEALASEITAKRRDVAIFGSIDELADVPGMTPGTMDLLEDRAFLGPFSIRSQSYIGPVIGRELVQKAVFAILGSLAGMLVYIWIRFQFQWGLAAVVALVHDTIISLGVFSLAGFEMSLPVVASFLTLIGYSVNDTVVVFDRVRENLKLRGSGNFRELINESINQTLSRTVLTSMLTWLVCLSLFFLGGSALRSFSFVLVFGIIIGTYSSIYIGAPILVVWHERIQGRKQRRPAQTEGSRPAARKVRSSGKA